jgi:transposase InsO family protein
VHQATTVASVREEGGRVIATRAADGAAIGAFIEHWYNRERRHSSLGCRIPVAFEPAVLHGGRVA